MSNVFFVGDELVAGHGDPKALGWAGRVAARTLPLAPHLRFHTLAVPGETTGELTSRWDEEALRRIGPDGVSGTTNFVLFAIGRHDLSHGISPTMTRLHLANTLDRASALGFRTMIAGPPPVAAEDRRAVAEYSALCEESAARRDVPYIDMYGPLARHEQWATDMAMSGGELPLQAGYGLMAWLVLHSTWHDWLGIPSSAPDA
ncbi:GDSL-type esterase/lipase family protein [Demequina aestuarii]|uniref:GDSL-type esterase/lipase family protein n=1 Tax=Demequina aestuarii TaxID=327095 RepID=UPI000781497E|nr:GDSL-type esterase/lipase family protein [Demequina aestuarii]